MADELYDYTGPEMNEDPEDEEWDEGNEYQYYIDAIDSFLEDMKDLTIPESEGLQKHWENVKGDLDYLRESLEVVGEPEEEDDW